MLSPRGWGDLSCSSVRAGIPTRLEFQRRNGLASKVKGNSQGRALPSAASLYRLPAEGVVKSLLSYLKGLEMDPPTSNQAPPPQSLTGVPSIPGSLFIPGTIRLTVESSHDRCRGQVPSAVDKPVTFPGGPKRNRRWTARSSWRQTAAPLGP